MFQFGFCLSSWNSMQTNFQLRLGLDWNDLYIPAITTATILGAMISSLGAGYTI